MRLDYAELKRLSLNFRTVAARLLRSDHLEGMQNIDRFLQFIDGSPVILEFVTSKCVETYDLSRVRSTMDFRDRWPVPTAADEEISFVYQLLKYVRENYDEPYAFTMGYEFSTNKIQPKFESFLKNVVLPFVTHISTHLEGLMDDMPERREAGGVNFRIDGNVQQLNIARDRSTIQAANVVGGNGDIEGLATRLLQQLAREHVAPEVREAVEELTQTAVEEAKAQKPKKNLILACAEKIPMLLKTATVGLETVQAGQALVETLTKFSS